MATKKKLQLLEMRINPASGSLVSAIALVGSPAIESNFLSFSSQQPQDKNPIKFAADAERMELLGAAMIPNKPMFRAGKEDQEDYFAVFSADTIRQISQVFAERGFFNNMNIDHTDKRAGSYVFQSYIVDSSKGVNAPIGVDAPDGSWVVGVKVNDTAVWEDIKSGKVNGFSVEGFFDLFDTSVEIELSKEQQQIIAEFEDAINDYNKTATGCLMFFPDVCCDQWELQAREIAPGALELEKEPHITIVYGFQPTPELPGLLKSFLSEALNEAPIDVELGRISKFPNTDKDVVKIDIIDCSGSLNALNVVISDMFGVISTYDKYKPHMTIAYIQPSPDLSFSSDRVYPWNFGFNYINKGRIVYSDGLGGTFELLTIK